MTTKTGFIAYPSNPGEVGSTIRNAAADLERYHAAIQPKLWEELDIPGRFIAESVLEGIDGSDVLIADITTLNFNVTYEIGFAIGRGKRAVLVQYEPFSHAKKELVQQLGIFDTLGFVGYQNSRELSSIIREINDFNPRTTPHQLNRKSPVYLTEDKWRTDGATRIISRIKKARIAYRSFDPTEQPRLSALDAMNQVAQSYGVLVHLVSKRQQDATISNLRSAFIAGLAQGMQKIVLILQQGDDPVPLDYRDFVSSYGHPQAIDEFVSEFAGKVYEAAQATTEIAATEPGTILERFDLGQSSAENELRDLADYYLPTEGFRRAQRGDVRLVLGRKGSGKTAIFLQVRDKMRSQGNVVLDFKPDGFRLIKFRDRVLKLLEKGSAEHTITAFWEFLLLIELAHKVLETDREVYMRDGDLIGPYRDLAAVYKRQGYDAQGDFAERMSRVLQRIENDFAEKYGGAGEKMLTTPEVTALIHRGEIIGLQRALIAYVSHKNSVWVMFDNIDKGWSSHGIERGDLVVVKALIEATRKVERVLQQADIDAHTLLFLRNDVYELLIDDLPDRGKEQKAVLDWTDPELLRELVRRRAAHAGCETASTFSELWRSVSVSHINGEESSQYLIDRCLMRPRYLIDLINHCRGNALTLQHPRIEADDIKKGVELLSSDLVADLGHEIRDVFGDSDSVIYAFAGSFKELSEDDIWLAFLEAKIPDDKRERLIGLLVWYGFLGVLDDEGEAKYIFNVHYDARVLNTYRNRRGAQTMCYQINPAFWPFLDIKV